MVSLSCVPWVALLQGVPYLCIMGWHCPTVLYGREPWGTAPQCPTEVSWVALPYSTPHPYIMGRCNSTVPHAHVPCVALPHGV